MHICLKLPKEFLESSKEDWGKNGDPPFLDTLLLENPKRVTHTFDENKINLLIHAGAATFPFFNLQQINKSLLRRMSMVSTNLQNKQNSCKKGKSVLLSKGYELSKYDAILYPLKFKQKTLLLF